MKCFVIFYLHWFHPCNLSQLLHPSNPNNSRFLLLQIPINEQKNIQKLDEQIKRNYKQIHTKQTVAPPASRGQWRLSSNLEITLCQSKITVLRKCTNPLRQQIMQVCTERNTMHWQKYKSSETTNNARLHRRKYSDMDGWCTQLNCIFSWREK